VEKDQKKKVNYGRNGSRVDLVTLALIFIIGNVLLSKS